MATTSEMRPAPVEEGELPGRLRIAVARLSRGLKPTTAAGALTTSEVEVLATTSRMGPVKLSELAVVVGLNPTMLSRIIAKLEDQRLLKRLGDESDRRVCRVQVTAAGARLHARVRSERNDVLSRQLQRLSAEERAALLEALPALELLAERLLERGDRSRPPPAKGTDPDALDSDAAG